MEQLLHDLRVFIESDRLGDVARMASLLSRVKNGASGMLQEVHSWVIDQGKVLVRAGATILTEYPKLPKVLFKRLLLNAILPM